jgi:hypothetical protein
MSLYTDRGSHYFHTPSAGGEVDRSRPTQVGRELERLGVDHIAAGARTLGTGVPTLQDGLVKELALARIPTIPAADVFLRDIYIPAHNARFGVVAGQTGTAFVRTPGVELDEILCVQEERRVGNNNYVTFNKLKLQIPESPLHAHFVKARVKVRLLPRRRPRDLPRPAMPSGQCRKRLVADRQAARAVPATSKPPRRRSTSAKTLLC